MPEKSENTKLDKIKIIHLVDTGGQSQFLEVLPMFARNSSAHLIVHPLNQDLKDIPSFKYTFNGQRYEVDQKMILSHEEHIAHYVQAICSGRYRQMGVQKNRFILPDKPHIGIIGMFKDMIMPGFNKLIERRNNEISQCLSNLKCLETVKFEPITPTRDLQKPVFAFDGSEHGWGSNSQELDKLQTVIADERRMISVDLPLCWFTFLQVLKEYSKREKVSFLTTEKCREIAQAKGIGMSAEKTEEALQLFDELNLILHYPSILPNVVFTIPAFLYRKVTQIIAESFTKSHCQSDPYQLQRSQFHDRGIFSLKLLNGSDFNSGFSDDFKVPDLLYLMKKLYIISEVDKDSYFMPCVLPLEKPDSVMLRTKNDLPYLYISFGDKISPRGLFCAIISSLVATPMFAVTKSHDHGTCKPKRNCIELKVEKDKKPAGTMLLWDRMTHFEVQCYGYDKETLPIVRKCFTNALYEAATVMHFDIGNVNPSIGFLCTCDREAHGTVVLEKNGVWHNQCLKQKRTKSQRFKSDSKQSLWYPEDTDENGKYYVKQLKE